MQGIDLESGGFRHPMGSSSCCYALQSCPTAEGLFFNIHLSAPVRFCSADLAPSGLLVS